eukprot:SAG31_NODE_12667_length_925_cov_3.135593_1_plen_72_part_10
MVGVTDVVAIADDTVQRSKYDIRELRPREIKCDKLSPVPMDASTGKIVNPKGWVASQRRADRDKFRDAYMKE